MGVAEVGCGGELETATQVQCAIDGTTDIGSQRAHAALNAHANAHLWRELRVGAVVVAPGRGRRSGARRLALDDVRVLGLRTVVAAAAAITVAVAAAEQAPARRARKGGDRAPLAALASGRRGVGGGGSGGAARRTSGGADGARTAAPHRWARAAAGARFC